MIVFRTVTNEDEPVQVNFCESGLYIQIGEDTADMYHMRSTIISDKEEIKCLIDYLNSEYGRLD
jgi:hypothetical protein